MNVAETDKAIASCMGMKGGIIRICEVRLVLRRLRIQLEYIVGKSLGADGVTDEMICVGCIVRRNGGISMLNIPGKS